MHKHWNARQSRYGRTMPGAHWAAVLRGGLFALVLISPLLFLWTWANAAAPRAPAVLRDLVPQVGGVLAAPAAAREPFLSPAIMRGEWR